MFCQILSKEEKTDDETGTVDYEELGIATSSENNWLKRSRTDVCSLILFRVPSATRKKVQNDNWENENVHRVHFTWNDVCVGLYRVSR